MRPGIAQLVFARLEQPMLLVQAICQSADLHLAGLLQRSGRGLILFQDLLVPAKLTPKLLNLSLVVLSHSSELAGGGERFLIRLIEPADPRLELGEPRPKLS